MVTATLVQDCNRDLCMYFTDKIILIWVPEHFGVDDNEYVDVLVR